MNTRTFFRWLEMHEVNAHRYDTPQSAEAAKKITDLLDADQLHNLWDRYDSPYMLFNSRLDNEQESFKGLSEAVFESGVEYTLIIDDVCFSDTSSPVAIGLNKDSLSAVLANFYLYLDEIYITVPDTSWFISINHHSELLFFGDRTKNGCSAAERRVRDFFYEDQKNEPEDN